MSARPLIDMPQGVEAYASVQADSDSSCFGSDKEKKANRHQARLDQLKSEFILMALKANQSEAESYRVGKCLEDNCTPDMLAGLVRSILKGEQLKTNTAALELMNAAAEYFADLEV